MNIPAPKPNRNDIYSLGFGRDLNRILPNSSTGVVYDNLEESLNVAQLLSGDNLVVKSISVGGLFRQVAPGDDVQTAIETVSREGGGVVKMKSGRYVENGNVDMRSGVTLEGVGINTVIDFVGRGGIVASGTLLTDDGTVAIGDGDTTVTGTLTSFTTDMEGKLMMIGGTSYTIDTVSSATSLTIVYPYYGPNLASEPFVIFDPVSNLCLKSFNIENGGNADVSAPAVRGEFVAGEFIMEKVQIFDSYGGINLENVEFPFLSNLLVFNMETYGVSLEGVAAVTFESTSSILCPNSFALGLTSVYNSIIHNCEFSDSDNGLEISGCANIGLENATSSRNTGFGVVVVDTSEIQFHQFNLEGNGSDGMRFSTGVDLSSVGQCNFNANGGWGFNIANANCDNNIALGNTFTGNTSGTISNSGTGTITRGNIGFADIG